MKFNIEIEKKDIIIALLSLLLFIVTIVRITADKPERSAEIPNWLTYGIVDDDIQYKIVYDQARNVSVISAELFGNKDIIKINGVKYQKIKNKSLKRKKRIN